MTVSRTIKLADLTPAELAELFCEMDSDQQAEFFAGIKLIAAKWPGAGWCQQSCDIARSLDADGREVIEKLAEHVLGYDELVGLLENPPLPSTMGTAEEHFRRFYTWLNGPVASALLKAKAHPHAG